MISISNGWHSKLKAQQSWTIVLFLIFSPPSQHGNSTDVTRHTTSTHHHLYSHFPHTSLSSHFQLEQKICNRSQVRQINKHQNTSIRVACDDTLRGEYYSSAEDYLPSYEIEMPSDEEESARLVFPADFSADDKNRNIKIIIMGATDIAINCLLFLLAEQGPNDLKVRVLHESWLAVSWREWCEQ